MMYVYALRTIYKEDWMQDLRLYRSEKGAFAAYHSQTHNWKAGASSHIKSIEVLQLPLCEAKVLIGEYNE